MLALFAAAAIVGVWVGLPSQEPASEAPADTAPAAESATAPVDVAPAAVPEPEPAPVPAASQDAARDRKGHFSDDFATLNAQREGVTTLPSGVQYEVLEAGSGPRPLVGGTVLVRYEASLADGRVFDTTLDGPEPARMSLDSLAIPGLREAVLLMPEGSRWRVVIPPSQGFGRSGNNMLRRRDVIYDIRLVSAVAPR